MLCDTCALNMPEQCPSPPRAVVTECGDYEPQEAPMAAIHEMARELHEIARLCCEATGEERGLRSALECVRAALEELRRYDVREMLRCPECSGVRISLGFDNMGKFAWYCREVERRDDKRCRASMLRADTWRTTPLAALLAWHGRDEG